MLDTATLTILKGQNCDIVSLVCKTDPTAGSKGISISAKAGAQRAFDEAVKLTKERQVFGKAVFSFQNIAFTFAGLKAKLIAGWANIEHCTARQLRRELTPVEAAAAQLSTPDYNGKWLMPLCNCTAAQDT